MGGRVGLNAIGALKRMTHGIAVMRYSPAGSPLSASAQASGVVSPLPGAVASYARSPAAIANPVSSVDANARTYVSCVGSNPYT